jgi:hypothetical protein
MEIVDSLLGVVGGAIAGFLTSLYFWSQNRKKERPRLIVEIRNSKMNTQAQFQIRNCGQSYAEDIVIKDLATNKTTYSFKELGPDAVERISFLNHDEFQDIQVEFLDVWKKKYQSKWNLVGPTKVDEFYVENGEEVYGGSFIDPYRIHRIY